MLDSYGIRTYFTRHATVENAMAGFVKGDFEECLQCGSKTSGAGI